ncbi:hypothetical protein BKE30_12060 [Alkanindiges hydrocarboniclasticus]|jgi:hypothetical protein|uniref:Uncharacterized protein n=1 Tax=Alkanindiges hydrocarboniclasticus TaxID=1907941 RepID=A0A1S8CTC8_9GAMM|nr:hypothetical protein [Alkanindiges hydrocarboniclasticus]ONG38660.1 hypothetical protein BKE30_12060 [Alkanindiges hydrocarboniclasticus]
MIKLKWNNRFLAALITLIVLFTAVVGWIIIRENTVTSTASYVSHSPINHVFNTAPPPVTTYAPSRAPQSAKQMYAHMQQTNAARPLSSEHSADQNYNMGYAWANDQKISNPEQCKMLSTEYLSGCLAYLEVKNYVNQTDTNPNTPRY